MELVSALRPPALLAAQAPGVSRGLSLVDEEDGADWRAPFQHMEALPDVEALSARRRDSLSKMQAMSVNPSVQHALQYVLVGLMPRVSPDAEPEAKLREMLIQAKKHGMTWELIVGLFGAYPGARDIPEAAFGAGLRCLRPTDFPLTETDLKRLAERFAAAAGASKAKAASGPGASGKAGGRLVSVTKLRDFAFAIPHVGWKAELARFRAAKEAAALAKPRSPKAPPQSPSAKGAAKARRPPPAQPARQPPATATTARTALLRRRSSANSSSSTTGTGATTSTSKGAPPAPSGPGSHAKPTTASTLRAQLQRANSSPSAARAGPAAPRRKSDAGLPLRRQPSNAGSSSAPAPSTLAQERSLESSPSK